MANTNDGCCDCETYCSGRDVESKKTYNQILDILKIANFQELKVIYAFLLSFLKIKG